MGLQNKNKNEHPGGLFDVFVVFMMFFKRITCRYRNYDVLELKVEPGN